jgi:hypothetical protein
LYLEANPNSSLNIFEIPGTDENKFNIFIVPHIHTSDYGLNHHSGLYPDSKAHKSISDIKHTR